MSVHQTGSGADYLNKGGESDIEDDTGDSQHISPLQRLALRFTNWTERWFPDSYVIALIALVIVCAAALLIGASPANVVSAVGDGYWNLIPFTYQMSMVVITGFALATCRPIRRGIDRLVRIPKTGPGAIAFIVVISNFGSLINWGFGMIFSAFVVMALARRSELRMDFRAAAAAALLGNATTSMLGLSSSAALLHATPSSLPEDLLLLSGVVPLTETVFLWQNIAVIAIVTTVAAVIGYRIAPRGATVRTAADLGIDAAKLGLEEDETGSTRPGDWLSNSPLLTVLVGGLSITWIVTTMVDIGPLKTISNLNNYIFICLTLAFLLHWRIRRFLKAAYDAVPAIGAILIQFPIYAAVAAVIITAENSNGKSVSTYLGDLFVAVGGAHTLPLLVGLYSIIMGLFVPSAGAKWVLEAPYILHAANESETHLGWMINVYGGTEAVANLLNPFFMLPLLGLLHLRPRNVVGYTFVYFVFLAPVMLACTWLFSYTLDYHPPILP
ncbi:TIGR00366 family protein [Rhodococcus opacus]|uniref:TIGR00366 family protein n=1 Tax=Rhodococcus opacus TaxID=37919 RepID=UPI00294A052D|nr:TIGR00366 family protein [Rhodococcus opacus]MDV6244892.1 TIGR00366 family protein [Rhodococcus opacus]